MAKGTVYYCSECGYKSAKWVGKCPQCGAWSSFEEVDELPKDVKKTKNSDIKVYEFKDVEYTSEDRYKTKYEEFDRLLGGGLLKGEVVLVTGNPGIGNLLYFYKLLIHIKTMEIFYIFLVKNPQHRLKIEEKD